jgi:hypothetical protein
VELAPAVARLSAAAPNGRLELLVGEAEPTSRLVDADVRKSTPPACALVSVRDTAHLCAINDAVRKAQQGGSQS